MRVLQWNAMRKLFRNLPVSGNAGKIEEYRRRYAKVLPKSVSLTYALSTDGFVTWHLKNTKKAKPWEVKMMRRLANKVNGEFHVIETRVDTDIHKIMYRLGEKRVQR